MKMVYPDNFEFKIGFDRIRELLKEKCLSPMGIEKVDKISFETDSQLIMEKLSATMEFQQLLIYEENFPADNFFSFSQCLNKIRIEGSFPEVRELYDLKRSLETVRSILNFFRVREDTRYPILIKMCSRVKMYPYVIESVDRIIDRHGNVKDNASQKLKEIRSEILSKNLQASRRLTSILKQAQTDGIVDAETTVSVRNGRGVIPVNVYDKRRLRGLIHDQSASGKTVYVEPEEIVELNNVIIELEYEEKREIVRILIQFADNIRPYIDDLLESDNFLGEIDFLRAKALFGNHFRSVRPIISEKPCISWKGAVHPLLSMAFEKLPGKRKVVPLDITLDENNRILLISGPNAGGKSVCLKSVGLLQYMFQCGLTIPVEENSECGVFNEILIDIGDEQSIENDLSTYSSHLINMKYFLKNCSDRSLILIDEFGTGTEPMLGGAIAEAILGELNRRKVFGVLTTHYTNLKHYASLTEGIVNGAMAFDNHMMQPLFQLYIGKPGSSFAFEIARKIGLPEEILNAASEKAGVKNINYDRHLKDIARDKRYWETKRQNIRHHEKRLEELIEEYERELAGANEVKKEIISKARNEAENLLKESNRIIENTIRQIKESQAEKERTRDVRRQLEEFKSKVAEEFKSKVTDETGPVESDTEKKISGLIRKAKKSSPAPSGDKPFKIGDAVRMTDTMAAGEITDIKDNMIQVETGSFRFVVSSDKVERISRSELRKINKSGQFRIQSDPALQERKLSFRPEIDIRGMRGEEAIRQVQDLIDNALMVQHRNLRILHGKGNGILRQIIRQYLNTVDVVKSFHDEHVDMGGSGITVVEMDF